MIIPIYDYLFYKIYKFALKTPSADFAELSSLISISLLNIMNLISIAKIDFEAFFPETSNLGSFIALTFLYLMNYFLFIFKKRYKKIESKYDATSTKSQKIGSVLVLAYVVLSFIFIFFI